MATTAGQIGTEATVTHLPWRRASMRAERFKAGRELQKLVIRAQLRVDLLMTVHQASLHPLAVVNALTAPATIVGQLDKAMVDLSEVLGAWRRVQDGSAAAVVASADELLVSLAELLRHVDPGWHRPVRRRNVRTAAADAKKNYEQKLLRFDALLAAHYAASRSTRRKGQQFLEACGASST